MLNIAENICVPVPHRQLVFTMPKRERRSTRAPPRKAEPEQGTLDLEHVPFEDLAVTP
ncbi:MAG: hypothetical protein R6U98_36650 [Pirellulaceae bacterium]